MKSLNLRIAEHRARKANGEEGFTLIELMIVVVIIGILTAIAIPIFGEQQKAALAATVKADVRNTLTSVGDTLVKNPTTQDVAADLGGIANQPMDFPTKPKGYVMSQEASKMTIVGGWDSYLIKEINKDAGVCYEFDARIGQLVDCNESTGNNTECVSDAGSAYDFAADMYYQYKNNPQWGHDVSTKEKFMDVWTSTPDKGYPAECDAAAAAAYDDHAVSSGGNNGGTSNPQPTQDGMAALKAAAASVNVTACLRAATPQDNYGAGMVVSEDDRNACYAAEGFTSGVNEIEYVDGWVQNPSFSSNPTDTASQMNGTDLPPYTGCSTARFKDNQPPQMFCNGVRMP